MIYFSPKVLHPLQDVKLSSKDSNGIAETYKLLSDEERKYLITSVVKICPKSKFATVNNSAFITRLPGIRFENEL